MFIIHLKRSYPPLCLSQREPRAGSICAMNQGGCQSRDLPLWMLPGALLVEKKVNKLKYVFRHASELRKHPFATKLCAIKHVVILAAVSGTVSKGRPPEAQPFSNLAFTTKPRSPIKEEKEHRQGTAHPRDRLLANFGFRTWPWSNPVPPVNIPIPTNIGSKMGGASTPKWDLIGFAGFAARSKESPGSRVSTFSSKASLTTFMGSAVGSTSLYGKLNIGPLTRKSLFWGVDQF